MSQPKKGRHLVVDCDVLTSAGTRDNPRSTVCRLALEAIRDNGHTIHFSPQLQREWTDHVAPQPGKGPSYGYTWSLQMLRARRLKLLPQQPDSGIAHAVAQLPVRAPEQRAMQKDVHLLETALLHDHIILSRDENAYCLFFDAAATIPRLRTLMWVNPERPADACATWVSKGARTAGHRCISRRPKTTP